MSDREAPIPLRLPAPDATARIYLADVDTERTTHHLLAELEQRIADVDRQLAQRARRLRTLDRYMLGILVWLLVVAAVDTIRAIA